ncbi:MULTISPECIES: SDR family oxidoreductase [unclassified Fusibacter]|uniref:SDR family NAD(P)-dependent oxidoreductase n=1 Tax=unclassified Fusibacter TaxID=2624464 RepID=UPI0010113071|nr:MULTISPECIES: SDR family oxidoreductase [unclassified Fusibacter]MCK8059014.1 SDR family oxidoreductase [Fusibacter sp. A2]NPE22425.1 SDR family oxidoreductase [Fusibacter sp. A1]RXV60530.1 SDR family NAD(P)-dependent oxidoreductase [Fusibacter sp. A1]
MISTNLKWAFVTGASRGIGCELSLFLAQKGFNLLLHARKRENLAAVKEKVESLGSIVHTFEAELSDSDQVIEMLAKIDELALRVDYVFNNAGIQIAYRHDFFKTPVEDFDLSNKINLVAPMQICYHFLPKMIANDFGRIVNTTSGIKNEPEQAGYSASKAALDKVTKDIGSKLEGTDVMINLVDPGWCRTDLGGPSAPNDPRSTLPGVALPAFLNDKKSGRIFEAQDFKDMLLEEAIDFVQKSTINQ